MDDRVGTLEIAVQQFMKELGIPGRKHPLYDGAVAHSVEKFVQQAGAKRHGGCRGIMGWMFGHRFESRVSHEKLTSPVVLGEQRGGWMHLENVPLHPNEDRTTYHGDVCTRCGLVVNRLPSP